MTPRRPSPPKALGTAGAALWKALNASLDFDEHERPMVLLACAQADDVAALEQVLATEGTSVIGSTGQNRLSPVFTELRQSRLALAKLISELAIPADVDAAAMTPAQKRAHHAASTRWANVEAKRAKRA